MVKKNWYIAIMGSSCMNVLNCVSFTNNYLTSNTNPSLDVYGEPCGSLVDSYNELKIVSPTFNLNSTFDAVEWKYELLLENI